MICPVDAKGCFTEEVPDFVGQYVKDADKQINKKLKQEGLYVEAAGGKLVLHQQSSFKDQDHKKLHEDGSKGARFSRRSHFETET